VAKAKVSEPGSKPETAKSAGAFRTIGEVADELRLPQHVLRFWEKKFHQVKPVKRNGGRRYYRIEDVALLQEIRVLLHEQGYTIKGVQKLLREGGLAKSVRQRATAVERKAEPQKAQPKPADTQQFLMPLDLLSDVSGMRQMLQAALAEIEAMQAELAPHIR